MDGARTVWRRRAAGCRPMGSRTRTSLAPRLTAMTNPIMLVRGLTRVHRTAAGPLTVLSEVNFTIQRGETCAITGRSGSGKTTLLGLCAGLDLPTSGSVILDGHELTALNEDERAKLRNDLIGFVFQNFQLLPTLTALENVLIPLELRGGRVDRNRGRVPTPGDRSTATASTARPSRGAWSNPDSRSSAAPYCARTASSRNSIVSRVLTSKPSHLFINIPGEAR